MPFDSANRLHIGKIVRHFSSLDSTNSYAASQSGDAANHGLVVTAAAQTSGRGQYDRVWQAPTGSSILMSVLLFPPPQLRRASILTAWAGVSVCETIREVTNLQAKIKWPNDVLIEGKKVCGILCEGGSKHIVAGIGLNVNQTADDFGKNGLPDAVSLATAAGRSFDIDGLTQELISRLDFNYDRLVHGEFAALEADWKWRIGLLGKAVVAEFMDGSTLNGRLLDIGFGGMGIASDAGDYNSIAPESIRHLTALSSST